MKQLIKMIKNYWLNHHQKLKPNKFPSSSGSFCKALTLSASNLTTALGNAVNLSLLIKTNPKKSLKLYCTELSYATHQRWHQASFPKLICWTDHSILCILRWPSTKIFYLHLSHPPSLNKELKKKQLNSTHLRSQNI